ncbi:IS5/IS1182 family transposase, partial [Streptomyces sp. TX20-6-3]|nr:IS5/IS1182 family transposase [Streptomyces sp. TX20-6-3]
KALGPLPQRPRLGLDAGYDYRPVHDDLAERGIDARITPRGEKVPIQVGGRWVVERTNSWMNNFGKLRRCTERRRSAVEFYIALACVFVTVRYLIRRAWTRYRWETRPRTPRIR